MPESTLTVQWYLHVNVLDYFDNPVPNANVKIEDNINSSYNKTYSADVNGNIRWLTVTEYIEQDTDGNTIGKKTYHTPHKIVAWNDTLVGFARPIMNESKTITIVLYNGTLMDLEPGWNLISIPRIQSDTNLPTVLQSIEGQYDAVQWYNVTDSNDPWKRNIISKPSNMNDLNAVNRMMGLKIHITDPSGTTLVVFGDVLTSTQNIPLYNGWNLVGYPSNIARTPDFGLPPSVDMVQWFNSSLGIWESWDPGDYSPDNLEYIKPGQGLWIHSTEFVDEWLIEPDISFTVDYIAIVDTPNIGIVNISDMTLDVGVTIVGYCAAFNSSVGYIGDVTVTWSVNNVGSNANTNPLKSDTSAFYSGPDAGTATWTATYGLLTDEVIFTVNPPTVDFIVILDTPGGLGNAIVDQNIDVGVTVTGYVAGYNITSGYIGDYSVTWDVSNAGSSANTNPASGDSSDFYSGSQAGVATWTADLGGGISYSVDFTVNPPTVDFIMIVDDMGAEIMDQAIGVGMTFTGYVWVFNNTIGYLNDASVTWTVMNVGSNANTNPGSGLTSDFYSGTQGGTATWIADDGDSHTDAVVFTIIP
jgi:hypothetical protein